MTRTYEIKPAIRTTTHDEVARVLWTKPRQFRDIVEMVGLRMNNPTERAHVKRILSGLKRLGRAAYHPVSGTWATLDVHHLKP